MNKNKVTITHFTTIVAYLEEKFVIFKEKYFV